MLVKECDVLISGRTKRSVLVLWCLADIYKALYTQEIEKKLSLLIHYHEHGIIFVLYLLTQSQIFVPVSSVVFLLLFLLALFRCRLFLVAVDCFLNSFVLVFLQVELLVDNGASAQILH